MRVLVCGGRDFKDFDRVVVVLDNLDPPATLIIHGGAPGADQCAGAWAERRGIPTLRFPAEWEKYGRRAGPRRNQRMLDEGKPDLVVAFPGGRGTADMLARADKAGVVVWS